MTTGVARVLVIGGIELVTAQDVRERWGDVRAARLRAWCLPTAYRPALLAPVSVRELAALTGRRVPGGTDPMAPARAVGASGQENLYDWQAVVRADRRSRQATRGISRRAA
jgi:hypothetical protein